MKEVNIVLLERILEGIWSGELEHCQKTYFCGSARCVAGWTVVLSKSQEEIDKIDFLKYEEA